MSFSLIREIASQVWLLQPDYAEQVAPFVASLLTGNAQPWEMKDNAAILVSQANNRIEKAESDDPYKQIPAGSTAIYRIQGPLMKNDQMCGPKGMESMSRELQELDANPNIEAIVLSIDSPGGTVAGTEAMARTIAGLKKPVVAYVDGNMASAAYWIGSAAMHVMIGGHTSAVGSIGTISNMADFKPVLEKAGVKFHTVKATRSTDKNSEFEEALEGNYDSFRTKILDPINEAFMSAIESNRAGKINLEKEDVLTGKMYIGKKAIKAGLADSMGSLQDAVDMARKLSKTKTLPKMKILQQYPTLSAVAAIDAEAELLPVGSVELTAEELQAIEQHLAQNSDAAELRTQIADANLANQQAEQTIANLQATSEAHSARITELEAQVAQLEQATEDVNDTNKERDNFVHQQQKPKMNSMMAYAAQYGIVSKS